MEEILRRGGGGCETVTGSKNSLRYSIRLYDLDIGMQRHQIKSVDLFEALKHHFGGAGRSASENDCN